jgi:putative ABC transport system permease protein
MWSRFVAPTLRHLRRRPVYAAINIVGLTVGLAACLLVGLYIYEELRFDAFHEKADRIKVLAIESDFFGQTTATSYPMATVLQDASPRVEAAVRTSGASTQPVTRSDRSATVELKTVATEASFADVFSFPVVAGDLQQALREPGGIALTASAAERLFGDAAPVGETVQVGDQATTRTVRAVLADVPRQSTLQFEALTPIANPDEKAGQWGMLMYRTYVLLQAPMATDAFVEHASEILNSKEEKGWTYDAIGLPGFYLSSLYDAEGFRGQQQYLYIFGIAALLVLLVAGINYVNLATVQGQQRAREVAVRKTMGAGRGSLALQFLGESVVLAVGAAVAAAGVAALLLPAFNSVMQTELSLLEHGFVIAGLLLGVSVVVGVLAGAYPGLAVAQFSPVAVLRRHGSTSTSGGGWVHRGLVVVQFAVSVVLIASTAVIYQQLQYVQTKNLGFEGEQVAYVSVPSEAWEQREALRQQVRQHPAIEEATAAAGLPSELGTRFGLAPDKFSEEHGLPESVDQVSFQPALVDPHYVETLGLEVVAGRSLDPDRPSDQTRSVLLNEAGAEEMGWTPEEAVGKPFSLGDKPGEVVGVIKNFHTGSLRKDIPPVVMQAYTTNNWGVSAGELAVRLAPDRIEAGVQHLREQLGAVAPSATAEVTFLDDTFDAMYRSEQRLSWLFTALAAVALIVACLGLYGLAAHAVQQRTKEIGIRKALGATVGHVVTLITREYALLIGVALVVGAPVAYELMQRWLQDFAYRIDVGLTPFAATAVLALVVAALGLGGHAVRAARTDPTVALRDE